MSPTTAKRLSVGLALVCALSLVGNGWLIWNYGWLKIHAISAEEQTRIFDDMRTQALESNDAGRIASYLAYAANYYPSGTKQRTGSRLDRAVERHRAAVVREIIAHLRRTTGEDLGESAQRWIARFGQPDGRSAVLLNPAEVLAIARQAVTTNDTWIDRAEFEAPRRNPDGSWSVMVWRLPKTPGGDRLITIDENGNVTRYIRGQ